MGSNNGAKAIWKCKFGCPNSNFACKHLESLMPKINKHCYRTESIRARDFERVSEKQMQHFWGSSHTEEKFSAFLSKFKLPEHETEVLVARFVYNKTFKEIKEECGYTSVSVVHGVLMRCLAKIKRLIETKRV